MSSLFGITNYHYLYSKHFPLVAGSSGPSIKVLARGPGKVLARGAGKVLRREEI